jgi:NAD(P)H dehydrogenase (quinone)
MQKTIDMYKILVTGATGQLGKIVVEELLAKVNAQSITVLVREPDKAAGWKNKGINVVVGNYTDYPSLLAAFKGIDKLYFISSSDKTARFAQHENVINAAVEAGVVHLIYTSAHRKSEDPDSPLAGDAHWQTDALIKRADLTYTILKHGLYTELLPLFIGNHVLDTSSIYLPGGEGRSSYATRADLAAAGAVVLTTDGHENKTYDLCSPVSYSFQDIAEIMSELSGKNIAYVSPPTEAYIERLYAQGASDKFLKGVLLFCTALVRGEFDFPSLDLQVLLGREPQSVKDYLKIAYGL